MPELQLTLNFYSYVNMDYFFTSSLLGALTDRLVVSYDIACQWSQNSMAHCQSYPPNALSQAQDLRVTYLVPKFHLSAHISSCQARYSFNFEPFVGRMDGEAPEHAWADSNGVATSTREMGPGSWRDTLDDHFAYYNWSKITSFGK